MTNSVHDLDLRIPVGWTGIWRGHRSTRIVLVDLKTEVNNRNAVATRAAAITAVSRWIDLSYNGRRAHCALTMRSPIAFEEHLITTTAVTQAAQPDPTLRRVNLT